MRDNLQPGRQFGPLRPSGSRMPKAIPAISYLRTPDSLPAAPIYAVFGDEEWLRRRALRTLTESLTRRGLDVRRIHDLESAAPLLDELRSPNMFGGALAMVVVNHRQGPRHEASTRFKEEFAAYIEKPSRSNVLVFDAATWQRNLTVPKRVEERFPTVCAEEIKPWDHGSWEQLAQMQAAEHGISLDREAVSALRDAVAGSLSRAEMEISKLALLSKGKKVTAPDVAFACGYEGTDVTFALCDAILTGDSKTALRHAAKMAGKAETGSILSLLGLLRLQVATLGRVALNLSRGMAGQEALAAGAPRAREAVKSGLLRTAKKVNRQALAGALGVLLAADEDVKSANPDPAALLISVVTRLLECLGCAKPEVPAVRS
ncbi:DNA polymerase III subunit delta [bacterium]|nr:MAG: DNA polymerase III subunit delta [bacterium]RIK65264.1 MAG: DNA polymerase III subunit delta [Planctomycetota bacterium]